MILEMRQRRWLRGLNVEKSLKRVKMATNIVAEEVIYAV